MTPKVLLNQLILIKGNPNGQNEFKMKCNNSTITGRRSVCLSTEHTQSRVEAMPFGQHRLMNAERDGDGDREEAEEDL